MMLCKERFVQPLSPTQRQYEALRAHYVDGKPARVAADQFGYTLGAYYALMHEVRTKTADPHAFSAYFFCQKKAGRKPSPEQDKTEELILTLRKKYLSVPDIKAILDTMGIGVSETLIYQTLHRHGFARLPRRSAPARDQALGATRLEAPPSAALAFIPERFTTPNSLGLLCVLPYIERYGIDRLIEASAYPETRAMSRRCSLLSFVALKLSNIKRYSQDDLWCMDRGLGLFAGLNVLPKAAWLSSYSHRVTRTMNLQFLQRLHQLCSDQGWLSDTANLDFTTIPYWGEDSHLENNWSGTRHKALPSLLAVLGQDPDSGLITYGDTNVRHDHKAQVVVEFLDFYSQSSATALQYLVFDSQFTTYQNLRKLDQRGIKFITIRRRGKNIVAELAALAPSQWRTIRVADSSGKGRSLSVADQTVKVRDYGAMLRQVAIAGKGRIKPALIITNDFTLPAEQVVHKYARRWLVEKEIAQQMDFFHLNRVSSSMVIKVDFDLTMSILAHNLLRLLAADLPGYAHLSAQSLFNRFLHNSGQVSITADEVIVSLRKKRHLPALLSAMESFNGQPCRLLENRKLSFVGDARS